MLNLESFEPIVNRIRQSKNTHGIESLVFGNISVNLSYLKLEDNRINVRIEKFKLDFVQQLYKQFGIDLKDINKIVDLYYQRCMEANIIHQLAFKPIFDIASFFTAYNGLKSHFPLKDRNVISYESHLFKKELLTKKIPMVLVDFYLDFFSNSPVPYILITLPLAREEKFQVRLTAFGNIDEIDSVIKHHLRIRMKSLLNGATRNYISKQEFKISDFDSMCRHMQLRDMINY